MSVVTYTTFDDEIVYENRNGVQHDYMCDSLGSTYALLDDTQTMTDTFTYWPYGEIRTQTGSTGTPFMFCGTGGSYFDSESGLNYARARFLIVALARWLTVDPLWPDQPDYAYAPQPVTESDSSGLGPWIPSSLTLSPNEVTIIRFLAAIKASPHYGPGPKPASSISTGEFASPPAIGLVKPPKLLTLTAGVWTITTPIPGLSKTFQGIESRNIDYERVKWGVVTVKVTVPIGP